VNQPAAPCGICRQVLLESEETQKQNIKIILQGETGPVLIFNSVKDIVPFYFGASDF
jgi:cytidine deaminase